MIERRGVFLERRVTVESTLPPLRHGRPRLSRESKEGMLELRNVSYPYGDVGDVNVAIGARQLVVLKNRSVLTSPQSTYGRG